MYELISSSESEFDMRQTYKMIVKIEASEMRSGNLILLLISVEIGFFLSWMKSKPKRTPNIELIKKIRT